MKKHGQKHINALRSFEIHTPTFSRRISSERTVDPRTSRSLDKLETGFTGSTHRCRGISGDQGDQEELTCMNDAADHIGLPSAAGPDGSQVCT